MIHKAADAIRNWTDAQIQRFGVAAAVVSVVVSFLITATAVLVVGFVLPFSSSNRDAAVGDAFAAGIFLLAIVAAAVAVLAYAQASRRPKLETSWVFESLVDGRRISESEFPRDPNSRRFTDRAPDAVIEGPISLVPLEPAVLYLTLDNYGNVAAKNVAVLFRLEGIYFSPAPTVNRPWSLYPTDLGWKVQWEGGVDRPVYPGVIPRTPRLELTGMWALSEITHTDLGGVFTFADDLKQPDEQSLEINAARSPADVPVEATTS
jgi:hypothetical protein